MSSALQTASKVVSESGSQATKPGGFHLPHLRWLIIGLIFLATLINYIDRLTISVLAPVIRESLHLSNLQYASLGTWFLFAYTVSQLLSGKLYDRIGTRLGFTFSVIVWSVASLLHAAARGLTSLSVFRFILGLGEAGNWPGAAKVVAEWFPIRERAFALGIFNSGAALGSVFAPPLIVWLQFRFGWQATFLITGALGFVWLGLWLIFYRTPETHRWLSASERQLILELPTGTPEASSRSKELAPSWLSLLRHRQVWAIVIARLLVDPIWWLYIFWLPEYLNKARGFSLKEIGLFAWVPYVAADAGSLLGGYLSGYLIKRGWSVDRARKILLLASAALMPAGIIAVRVDSPMLALALIGIVLFGFQSWINNLQTLPSDLFPSSAVASVAGMGGAGAGISSMFFILATGWVVDHFSYTPVLTAAGLLGPLGAIVFFLMIGKIKRVEMKA
jgi:ACS family hexuronate transporter-like MFS transporter